VRRINTIEELKAEKQRLQARRLFLESEIKKEFNEIKAGFNPEQLISRGVKSTVASEKSHLLGDSAGQFAKTIARIALKRSGLLPRLLLPFLVKKVASKLVDDNKGKIADWVSGIFEKTGIVRKTRKQDVNHQM
jgi:hypothetical protein